MRGNRTRPHRRPAGRLPIYACLGDGGAHGLWIVNQLCDLVELRSYAAETTVRVHLRLDGGLG